MSHTGGNVCECNGGPPCECPDCGHADCVYLPGNEERPLARPRGLVRMFMSEADGLDVGVSMRIAAPDDRQALRDQLWLHAVLHEQRKRTSNTDRPSFDGRADRILERLDP